MTEAQQAHHRLLESGLPRRTHHRVDPETERVERGFQKGNKMRFGTETRSGVSAPVRIGRMVYDSITQAAKISRHSPKTIYRMLQTGQAEFV